MIWSQSTKEIAQQLDTNFVTGLSSKKAEQLLKALGPNALPVAKKIVIWKILMKHFIEPFVIVLIVLAIIAIVIQQWQEAIVVFLIVIIDATLSTYQEVKTASSLDSLKKLVSTQAVVIRDGNKHNIDTRDLVIGDLVYLDAGMFVAADLRIIQSYNLCTNESLLTGESSLVRKTTAPILAPKLPIAERTNLAFMSTTIATGSGLGIVYATGQKSEIGKISKLLQEIKEPISPLTKQMTFLIRIISLFALTLGIVMFLSQYLLGHKEAGSALIFGIALTIAIIPEGLQVIVTVALSLGSLRMAKKHAIIKNLPAVETLGKVDIICSDKTGTLTENKMTVKKYYLSKSVLDYNNFTKQTKQAQLFLDCLVLCNNSSLTNKKIVGDPTEAALINWYEELQFSSKKLTTENKRIYEIPFDSERKIMSTIYNYDHQIYAFVKGAADSMINLCTHILLDNEKIKLTTQLKTEILLAIDQMANDALRVLGTSYKVITNPKQDYSNITKIENELIFLGLIGMIDPPRKEVKAALIRTKRAGIDIVMITGDHLNTALAIGQELGLINNKSQAISGNEIDEMLEATFNANINNYRIFARVSPEHKVKIVKALQSHNKIVSMTGDGVNDAASLKVANIGVAMGITGTDVAKDAAQMVLTDDNFTTIVDAIEEGRNIYNKIKRIVCFILITNMAQVLAIIAGAVFKGNELLAPIQILWINLIVESVIAIPMSMGPNNPDLMLDKPEKPNNSILSGSYFKIAIISIILSTLLILAFQFLPLMLNENKKGYMFVFVIMVNAPIFYAFSFVTGTKTSIFSKITLKNKFLWMAAIIAFIINTIIIFTPKINEVFSIHQDFGLVDWLIGIALATIPMWLLEIDKGIKILVKYLKK